MKSNLLLFFAIALNADNNLHQGRLNLVDTDARGILGRWRATSGLPGLQNIGDWEHKGGGVIPATYEVNPSIPFYNVQVNPVDLSSTKGIEGNGYPISPNSVLTKNGTQRGDFLIHRDANVPGTLGCIGLLETDWADFEKVFASYAEGMDSINLLISHTY